MKEVVKQRQDAGVAVAPDVGEGDRERLIDVARHPLKSFVELGKLTTLHQRPLCGLWVLVVGLRDANEGRAALARAVTSR